MIAQTILKQLGGNKFIAMTGAYKFRDNQNELSFKIPNNPSKINYVKITLTPLDTYNITFGRIWGSNYKILHNLENIYNHQLKSTFTEYTGMDTSL